VLDALVRLSQCRGVRSKPLSSSRTSGSRAVLVENILADVPFLWPRVDVLSHLPLQLACWAACARCSTAFRVPR
jgi:hypothetical protein